MEETTLSKQKAEEIMDGLRRADEAATERGKGKDLVLILGNTGAGKSTFVNYAMGKTMVSQSLPDSLEESFVCEDPFMEIGHGFESTTNFPESCCDASSNLTFCDCPGFLDNRGVVFDITNMYAISRMAQVARSVKGVVIVFNYHSLMSDRARGLRETASLLDTIFGSQGSAHASSIMLLVTRVPAHTKLEQLRNYLGSAVSSGYVSQTNDSHRLFQHLAATCEFYDPLDRYCDAAHQRSSRVQLVRQFQHFSGVPHDSLNVAMTKEATNTLSLLLSTLKERARENFKENKIQDVLMFLATVEGLRVLRCAEVEKHYGDFKQFMVSELHAWSKDLELLPNVQDVGVQIPALADCVDSIVANMVKEIKEKRAAGERIDLMESDLELAKTEVRTKQLANEKLIAEAKETQAKLDSNTAEVTKIQSSLKSMEEEMKSSKRETERLREELSRPRPSDGGITMDMLRQLGFASGGGMGGGGGVPGCGMNEAFQGMDLGGPSRHRDSSSHRGNRGYSAMPSAAAAGAVYRSNGSANGRTLHTGPRGGTYYKTAGGNKRYV
jgi:hypothetical protein